MNEYRDDLAAAHRRIAVLEGALHAAPTPAPMPASVAAPSRRGTIPVAAWLVACIMSASFAFAAGSSAIDKHAVAPPSEAPARRDPLNASWFTQSSVLPTMVDVDDDGTRDLVGLFMGNSNEDRRLYVVAIDGATFAPKWTAGPYASERFDPGTHLVVARDKVVLTDSRNDVITLALATGTELSRHTLESSASQACAFDGHYSGKVVLRGSSDAPGKGRLFDADTGRVEPLPADSRCATRYDECEAMRWAGGPCFRAGALRGAQRSKSFHVARTQHYGQRAVEIGVETTAASGRDVPSAVGYAYDNTTVLWRSPIAADGDELQPGSLQTELRDDSLVSFYRAQSGAFVIVSRNGATGETEWKTTVRDTNDRSYAAAFGVDRDRVLVVVDRTLHVIDAVTGAYLKQIDASTF